MARARGYRSARIDTTVHYSASTAKVMLLARRAATSVRALAPSGSASASVLGPTLDSPAGRALFMQGCNNTPGQEQACTCFYDHLARSGAFNSRSKQTAAMNQIIQAASDDNVAEIPSRCARRRRRAYRWRCRCRQPAALHRVSLPWVRDSQGASRLSA